MTTPRSLEVRLTEYRDMTRSMAEQIGALVEALPEHLDTEGHEARLALQATVDVQRHVADDITKIIAGEELQRWAIMGEVPR